MVGLQATAIKMQLGPLLNGIITYDFWLPWAGFASDEGREFVKKYQTKSAEAGVDLLGYYLPPFAYARMQLIEQAVKAVGSADDAKLAEFARKNTFKTVVGDVKFNEDGEWAEAQVMAVQFQGVSGNGVEQFKDPKTEVILWPTKYKTGNVIYPYDPKK
jgi:branched-chain amino acid transport system substrate-binding protein